MSTRYYNPELGRFLNADALASTGQGLLGYNMFAYCNNDPVFSADHEGKGPVAVGISVGAIISMAKVVATVAAVSAVVVAATKRETQKKKPQTIYILSNPVNNEVVYVGRTTDYKKRMQAHGLNPARRGLTPTVLHENLTYKQARAAEQLYIMHYSTLDKSNKAKNQINGVNPNRRDYLDIMNNGFGISEALDSILTNEVLILFE